ncbi:DUF134 domain-containing protein [Candidatus Dependentiae bacterium]
MIRPLKRRCINTRPRASYYKPQGIPLKKLETIELQSDEIEAIKLKYVNNFNQTKSAQIMNISQSTFQRILASTNKKIADALINGKAIKIN